MFASVPGSVGLCGERFKVVPFWFSWVDEGSISSYEESLKLRYYCSSCVVYNEGDG